MKSFILGAIALFSFTLQAQNQNVTDVSKTTVTTIKDSDGEKTLVKSQNIQAVQNIELENADSKELNKNVKATPFQVTSTTQVTGPDGTMRTIAVDRSAFYSMGENKYQVVIDKTGYTIMNNGKNFGVLRPTSNNNYIYRTKDKISFGYFDEKGNLILETYDDKTDKMTVETYMLN